MSDSAGMTLVSTPAAPPSAWQMYRALCGVGVVCGLLIVSVFEITRPIILQNRIEARQRAIFDVIPGASTSATFRLDDDRFVRTTDADDGSEGFLVFAGYDQNGALLGLALEASGMGYQDTVAVLYGYSIEAQAIVGLRVLESRETPGLGDRVEVDADFRRNFERLDVSLDESGERIRHPIEAVKSGQKQHPWQIDCISGATITSKAIADMLRRSSVQWLPRIRPHAKVFRQRD